MAIIPENGPGRHRPTANENGHPTYRFAREIILRSNASNWSEAKGEWELEKIWFAPGGICLCGHPITEQCLIRNRVTGNAAVVGNVCVKRFLGLPSDGIFKGFHRIMRNQKAALNEDAARFGRVCGWLTQWEFDFCLKTALTHRPSMKELAKRVEINDRLLTALAAAGRGQ